MRSDGRQERKVRIGTAGWAVPKTYADATDGGSHLERYAQVMNCVEINSTFYHRHLEKTVARWAASVPEEFRFAVKLSKTITHEAKLIGCGAELEAFFAQLVPMREKLGPVLVQLPPKLKFDEAVAREFFSALREIYAGAVVLEPRHATWFGGDGERVMKEFQVARAMADPPAGSAAAGSPGGWPGLRYFRLHGSPRIYWSQYSQEFLRELADTIVADEVGVETWVIFDNTAMNHAFGDAMVLQKILAESEGAGGS